MQMNTTKKSSPRSALAADMIPPLCRCMYVCVKTRMRVGSSRAWARAADTGRSGTQTHTRERRHTTSTRAHGSANIRRMPRRQAIGEDVRSILSVPARARILARRPRPSRSVPPADGATRAARAPRGRETGGDGHSTLRTHAYCVALATHNMRACVRAGASLATGGVHKLRQRVQRQIAAQLWLLVTGPHRAVRVGPQTTRIGRLG